MRISSIWRCSKNSSGLTDIIIPAQTHYLVCSALSFSGVTFSPYLLHDYLWSRCFRQQDAAPWPQLNSLMVGPRPITVPWRCAQLMCLHLTLDPNGANTFFPRILDLKPRHSCNCKLQTLGADGRPISHRVAGEQRPVYRERRVSQKHREARNQDRQRQSQQCLDPRFQQRSRSSQPPLLLLRSLRHTVCLKVRFRNCHPRKSYSKMNLGAC